MKVNIDKDIGFHLPTSDEKSRCWILVVILLVVLGAAIMPLIKHKPLLVQSPVTDNNQLEFHQDNFKINQLEDELMKLKRQLLALDRESSVQQSTNKELNRKLFVVEDELVEAKEKLLLYEDILSADSNEQGLHIRHFGLREKNLQEDNKRYHYNIVLSQVRGGKDIIKGQFVLRVNGKENGVEKSYTHRELAADGVEANNLFSLKYYQSLEGDMVLPEGFIPENVMIWIIPKDKKLSTLRKNYQWKSLLKQVQTD